MAFLPARFRGRHSPLLEEGWNLRFGRRTTNRCHAAARTFDWRRPGGHLRCRAGVAFRPALLCARNRRANRRTVVATNQITSEKLGIFGSIDGVVHLGADLSLGRSSRSTVC